MLRVRPVARLTYLLERYTRFFFFKKERESENISKISKNNVFSFFYNVSGVQLARLDVGIIRQPNTSTNNEKKATTNKQNPLNTSYLPFKARPIAVRHHTLRSQANGSAFLEDVHQTVPRSTHCGFVLLSGIIR